MVDTCIGNDKQRDFPPWNELQLPFREHMTAAGFAPESIDTVLCTHLHVDHVGWNTRLVDGEWVPTFEQARYLFGREEWQAWEKTAAASEGEAHFGDSVLPVLDKGLVDLVESTHQITDEVSLIPTFGHAPGHVSVKIASKGEEAVITGDLMHHPIQCAELTGPAASTGTEHRRWRRGAPSSSATRTVLF